MKHLLFLPILLLSSCEEFKHVSPQPKLEAHEVTIYSLEGDKGDENYVLAYEDKGLPYRVSYPVAWKANLKVGQTILIIQSK